MNTLVDVIVELDNGKTTECVAKILKIDGDVFTIRYLSEVWGENVYEYETETYDIDRSCISGYYDSTQETDAGFVKLAKGRFAREDDSDSDYVPSEEEDTDTETDTDESVVESDTE